MNYASELSLNHTMWFRDQNFAFIYIPKVACTSWKLFLSLLNGYQSNETLKYSDVHDKRTLRLPFVAGLSQEHRESFLRLLLERKISCRTVIRDPKKRILSAYLDKILFHSNKNSYFSKSNQET